MLVDDYGNKLDHEAQRYLGVIDRNTRAMSQLIDDLLAFSKLGRQSMTYLEVDMRALAREAFDGLGEPQGQAPAELVLHTLPIVLGDRLLLRQVWANLLSNAVKY